MAVWFSKAVSPNANYTLSWDSKVRSRSSVYEPPNVSLSSRNARIKAGTTWLVPDPSYPRWDRSVAVWEIFCAWGLDDFRSSESFYSSVRFVSLSFTVPRTKTPLSSSLSSYFLESSGSPSGAVAPSLMLYGFDTVYLSYCGGDGIRVGWLMTVQTVWPLNQPDAR